MISALPGDGVQQRRGRRGRRHAHLATRGGEVSVVMEATSSPPGVPPNLDMPNDVLCRFDLPWTGEPAESGKVSYGVAPERTLQRSRVVIKRSSTPSSKTSLNRVCLRVGRATSVSSHPRAERHPKRALAGIH